MIICYDNELKNKPGDLIEIFDKIFELEYDDKLASFVPSGMYEDKIGLLKELYTKQSIK